MAAAARAEAEAGVGAAGLPSSPGSVLPQNDTDNLIAQLFEEEGQAGSSLSVLSSGAVQQQQSAGGTAPGSPSTYPPAGTARQEIQRQMEELREELRDGQSQWEVHEQIGKGGFGVVYKVGGCGAAGGDLSPACLGVGQLGGT